VKPIRFGALTRVSVTWLLPLILAVLSLAFAPLAAQPSSPQPSAPQPAPQPSAPPPPADSKKAGRQAKPCSCQEITDYEKVVQRKANAYQRIKVSKKRFSTYGDYRAEFDRQMGWTHSWSEGKGGGATASERETALQACRREHCDWICDVSIYGVHEAYHDWFDSKYKPESLVVNWVLDKTFGGYEQQLDHHITSELGAHDAELEFLHENMRQMQDRGTCEGLRGTPSDRELQDRFRLSRGRVSNFIRSWQR